MDENTVQISTRKSAALAVLFFFIFSVVCGQTGNVTIYSTGGLILRTGPLDVQNNYKGPSNPIRPYPHSRNVMGFSLCLGIGLEVDNVGFEYFAGLRYDVIHSLQGVDGNKYHKEFILDHHMNISYQVINLVYGVGASIVNTGKNILYCENVNNPILIKESLEFKTVNAFVIFPVWKILNLEAKVILMPWGYPHNQYNDYVMFSARIFYKFKFLNKEKKEG